MTNAASPSWATSRSCIAPGPVSPTSRSPSRSSRSWPAASRRSARLGTTAARSRSRWGWPIISAFILHHRLLHVRAGLGLPDLRWHLLVGVASWVVPKAGFFTGWLNLIGLLAIIASVAYGCATFFDLDVQHFFGRPRPTATHSQRVFCMFLVVLAVDRSAQHLQQPPDGRHQQHLGLVARRRRNRRVLILIFVPDHHQSISLRLHRAGQQLRGCSVARRTVQASGSPSCRSASCSPSTRSPASTPPRTCPRRRTRRRSRRPRASGSRSSTRPSAAGCCCSRSCSRSQDGEGV